MMTAPRADEGVKRSLREFSGTLALVGAGKMGGAMLEGWLALGLDAKKIVVFEPHPSAEVIALEKRGVQLNPPVQSVRESTVVVVAIKPQTASEAMPFLKSLVGPSTVVVSIMAGRTLGFLEQALPDAALVRSMPNSPAAIGRGITVAVTNRRATAAQRDLAHSLLVAMGEVEWVQDERLLDAVTAVSGSGPAYVFLIAECLARAGAAAGLPPDLAERLARVTVAGSGELLHRSPLDLATLRQNVTSPGGTTAAALDVLMGRDGLDPLMKKAVTAATKRSRELAG